MLKLISSAIYDSRNYQVLIDCSCSHCFMFLIYDSRNYQLLIDYSNYSRDGKESTIVEIIKSL